MNVLARISDLSRLSNSAIVNRICGAAVLAFLIIWLPSGPVAGQETASSSGSPEQPAASETQDTISQNEEDANDNAAQTTADTAIPLDQLTILVKPLKLKQVQAEADAWFELLCERSQAIADLQILSKQKSGDPQATAEDKSEILQEITDAKIIQTQLVERLGVVLESLKLKGGDTTEYENYVSAQRGLTLDTSDTAATWAAVKGWMKSDEGGVRWLWRAVNFFAILIAAWFITGIVSRIVKRWMDKSSRLSELAEDLIARCIRNVMMLIGLMVAITAIGVNIGPLLAALGATGFIVGFALQGTLSNFASGLMILVNRPFDLGDVVQAGGVTGKVAAMNLVSTTFKTFDNQKIIVPNNEIWDNVITNMTSQKTRRVDLVFGVGYGDDLQKTESLLAEIVNAHPDVLKEPKPVIKVNELADSSVNFICRPWTKTDDYWNVYWDITRTVKERFDAEGISIPFPQRDVHIHNESTTT